MAADLRFVAHAAERDAHELAVHRPRDRLAERGLADARRADEAEDRPLHRSPFAASASHRQVLDDALLDLVEIVVILVEHLARLDRIEPIFGRRRPTARRASSRDRCGSSGTRATPASCARADRPRGRRPPPPPPAAARPRSASAAPRPRRLALAELRPGSPSAAGAGRTGAARRSSPAAPRDSILPFQLEQRRSRATSAVDTASSLIDEAVLFEQPLLVLGLHVEEAGQQVGERSGSSMLMTSVAQSWDSPVASDSARSTAPAGAARARRPRSIAPSVSAAA